MIQLGDNADKDPAKKPNDMHTMSIFLLPRVSARYPQKWDVAIIPKKKNGYTSMFQQHCVYRI